MNWTGLAAMTWDALGGNEPELDAVFFRRLLEETPGTALDVGCGTGRLLLPYLKIGLDVHGLDSSDEMLELCRRKAIEQGLQPTLYHQAMQHINVPHQYRTIFVPWNGFQFVVNQAEVLATLQRFHAHLVQSGIAVITLRWHETWNALPRWREEVGRWRLIRQTTRPDDGARLSLHAKIEHVDLIEQIKTERRRYAITRQGCVIQEEFYQVQQRWYGRYEIELLLEKTGFRSVCVLGDYTDAKFAPWHAVMVCVAQK